MQKIMHIPTNALFVADFFHLGELGGPKLRAVSPALLSALYRTATVTVSYWEDWVRQLQFAAEEVLPAIEVARGKLSPAFWDSDPFALNLKFAAKQKFSCSKCNEGLENATVEISKRVASGNSAGKKR